MKRRSHLAVASLAAMLLACAIATAGEGVVTPVTAKGDAVTTRGTATPPITLGLFLPTAGPLAPTGEAVSQGARIAVRRANEAGGVGGRPIRLVTAASDRLWEGASGELVRLIYDEGAVAVIGAVDGRSAHLAEQVITRARGAALFVTPWASETTLTRIRVPWFFRMVPDDRLQAEVLAQEIFSTRDMRRVAVWVGGEYDGRAAAAAFRRAAPAGAVEEFMAQWPKGAADLAAGKSEIGTSPAVQRLRSRISTGEIDAIVLFAGPDEAGQVVTALSAMRSLPPLFGPLALSEPRFLDATAVGGAAITLIAPAEFAPERFEFEGQYEDAYGAAPTLPALYGHDAAMALIEAVRVAGAHDGDRLATMLSLLSFQGVTGEVRFNEQGGRDLVPALATAGGRTAVARRSDRESTER